MNVPFLTAVEYGVLACHLCGLVCRPTEVIEDAACPRCGAALHPRKQHSVAHSTALLVAAAIAYIPANVLPIVHSRSLFGAASDTIMSGVVFLWTSGSWPLAILVFFASVMVPLMKLITIALLLLAAHSWLPWRTLHWTQLYRVVERIGRWSMLDIYVVTLLVALVRLRGLAYIEAGPGAMWFALVVVLTMLAAQSFDPRLLWDAHRGSP